jgi:hypothetical protein
LPDSPVKWEDCASKRCIMSDEVRNEYLPYLPFDSGERHNGRRNKCIVVL